MRHKQTLRKIPRSRQTSRVFIYILKFKMVLIFITIAEVVFIIFWTNSQKSLGNTNFCIRQKKLIRPQHQIYMITYIHSKNYSRWQLLRMLQVLERSYVQLRKPFGLVLLKSFRTRCACLIIVILIGQQHENYVVTPKNCRFLRLLGRIQFKLVHRPVSTLGAVVSVCVHRSNTFVKNTVMCLLKECYSRRNTFFRC